MCALMLKHKPPPQRGFFAWFNRQIDRLTSGFGHAVEWVIKRMVIAFILLAVFLYAIWHIFRVLPTSFVPLEDQGYAMAAIIMPEAASLDRTRAVAERVDEIFKKIPGVENRAMVTGYSLLDSGYKTNAGTFFITFTDFEQRYKDIATAKMQNARAILTDFYKEAQKITGAVIIPIAPPAIPGIGTTGGFEFRYPGYRLRGSRRAGPGGAELPPEGARSERSHRSRNDLPCEHAAAARRGGPRQDHAARDPDSGRLQRHPGAVWLADREPVQPFQPGVVGHPAVGRAVPSHPR
jgi:hypothetical protein